MKPYHLFLKAMMFLPLCIFGQDGLYNSGSEFYIQKGALLHIEGSLQNNNNVSNAIIKNDGIIEISGHLYNQPGAFFQPFSDSSSRERAVRLIGSEKQLILGNFSSADTSGIYNLIIDKTSSDDTVEMQTALAIGGSLIFGSADTTKTYISTLPVTVNNGKGLLKTFSASGDEFLLDIQNGDTGALAGYPDLIVGGQPSTGFVLTSGKRGSDLGGLQRRIATASRYVFPVGTIEHGFNAVRLNFDSIPAGGGSVKGKFCDNSTAPGGVVGTLSPSCVGCPTNGPYGGADNLGYNKYFESNSCNNGLPQWITLEDGIKNHGYWSFSAADQRYYYLMEAFPNSFQQLGSPIDAARILKYPTAYGDDPSEATDDWTPYVESSVANISDLLAFTKNAGCYAGAGIPGGMYSGFSHFAFKAGKSGNALPVELLYLKAEAVDNSFIRISWATAIEIDNRGFEVQRSTDGTHFSTIGWVDGHNNSTTTNTYSFNDVSVSPNTTYYYRLNQLDYDGDAHKTDVVAASLKNNSLSDNTITVSAPFPNPTKSLTNIHIHSLRAGEMKVKVMNLLGQIITETAQVLSVGDNDMALNLGAIPAGQYVVSFQAADLNISKNITVIR